MIASYLPVRDLSRLVRSNRLFHDLLTPTLYTNFHSILNERGQTPLHWAAEHDELNVAQRLLDRGAPIAARNIPDEEAAVHIAARCGSVGVLNFLLSRGASVDVVDKDGRKPMHSAAWAGQDECIRLLLLDMPSCIERRSTITKASALHYATMAGNISTVGLLIDEGAHVDACDFRGATSLHMAATAGHYAVAANLLKSGADPTIGDRASSDTPLHDAAFEGNVDIVQLLLDAGAELTHNRSGETPMHRALSGSQVDVVRLLFESDKTNYTRKLTFGSLNLLHYAFICPNPPTLELLTLLLDYGVDINDCQSPETPSVLHFAATCGDISIVELLLSRGANVNSKGNSGMTPLHDAVATNRPEIISLLVRSGARVNDADTDGQTPLFFAVERGHEVAVRTLLELGADIDQPDCFGMSPLSRACAQCCVHINPGVVQVLLDADADVKSSDDEGLVALHHAAREGHTEVVRMLLRKGASVNVRDSCQCHGRSGTSPLDMAEQGGHDEVIGLLREAMGMIPA
ncbi:ankyrin repeat-containing domain protein [Geopyxis carbonaria]|nr:ankyrin repeat-containing domain protein [Geopyxis carbonaria]